MKPFAPGRGALAATLSRLKRAARRAREIWAELDYAQRRLLEIHTGAP
jgi:hypothetical protein